MTIRETSFALTRPIYVDMVRLIVADLPMMVGFYQQVLGLRLLERGQKEVVLGVDGRPLLTLTTLADVRLAPKTAAGLFHTAFLLPDRTELARWLRHAVRTGVVLEGASDHIVSEAIYLSDPEGNGIEIYADRSHDLWRFNPNGMVEMATRRLDLQALHDSIEEGAWHELPQGSAIGHIHLQVGDVLQADRFYADVLGLKIMARYPGASFFASGEYHHHIAANIWNSRGAGARADALTGLADYRLGFNDTGALETVVSALDAQGIASQKHADGVFLRDPWGIGLTLAG